jgi:phosphate transport system substrate-binding protein
LEAKNKMKKSPLLNRLSLPAACVGLLCLGIFLGPGQGALSKAAPAPAASPVLINGAGATFPQPIYSKWFEAYQQSHSGVEFNYQAVGSGAGIRQAMEKTVDFGASDMPMPDPLLAEAKQKLGCDLLHFPTVLGAAVPTYNIPGVSVALKFTPEALSNIYLGKITKWNDPAITGPNPGVNLPGMDIMVIHRSEGSGTTFIWTDYFSKVNPEWASKVGHNSSVNWPVGLGGKGNEGVAGLLKQTPGAIGYVELIYAIQNKLPYGLLKNAAGNFIKADLDSVTAAAAGTPMPDDFRVSITNAPGAKAYPISSFTWLLIPSHIADATKRDDIKAFLKWMMTDGQKDTEALAYAPLPKAVVAKEMKQLDRVQ